MIKNIVANFIGKFWSLLSVFLFVPLYIQILGFESYSIISFMLVIAGMIAVLDAGLTATLSREFARIDISQEEKVETLNSLEAIYIGIIGLVTIGLFFLSDWLAAHWMDVEGFQPSELSLFIKLISFDVAFQMLFRFYLGGILGLEKQVLANILQVGWGMLRNGLVVLVIYFSPTLTTFFTWQMGSTILLAIVTKFFLIKKLIGKSQLKFSVKIKKSTISRVWKFAGGMMLISLVGALNSQMDKIAISKLLSLGTLGYYTLAVSLSTALVTVVTPISVALLPRFTALYSGGEVETGKNIFKLVNILTTVLIFTLMVNMMIYSTELIWIWTGEIDLGIEGGKYLPYLAFSFGMLSLAIIPYNIAIANGYTKLNNVLGLLSLFLTLPGYWFFTKSHGAEGAASVLCVVQTLITLIYYYWINEKYLNIGIFTLFIKNMLFPLLIIFSIAWSISLIEFDRFNNRLITLIWIGGSTLICLTISGFLFLGKKQLNEFRVSLVAKKG